MKYWIIPHGGALSADIRFGLLDGEAVVSVIDVLRGLCDVDRDQAGKIWRRLKDRYPFDTENVRMMQFPGRRQRKTPVAVRADIMKIMMLPPQKRAAQHRAQVVDLLERAMDGDPKLIEELKARQAVIQGRARPKTKYLTARGPDRENAITMTKQLQGMLKEIMGGVQDPNVYREVFRPNMVAIKGMEPHTMVEIYGIPKGRVRDVLTPEENVALGFLELSQMRALERAIADGSTGRFAAVAVCNQVRSSLVDSGMSFLKAKVLPMKIYEIYIGTRIRTEGSERCEDIPHPDGVLMTTYRPELATRAFKILRDFATEVAKEDVPKGEQTG